MTDQTPSTKASVLSVVQWHFSFLLFFLFFFFSVAAPLKMDTSPKKGSFFPGSLNNLVTEIVDPILLNPSFLIVGVSLGFWGRHDFGVESHISWPRFSLAWLSGSKFYWVWTSFYCQVPPGPLTWQCLEESSLCIQKTPAM